MADALSVTGGGDNGAVAADFAFSTAAAAAAAAAVAVAAAGGAKFDVVINSSTEIKLGFVHYIRWLCSYD